MLEVYLTFSPCDLKNTYSGDGNNDKETKNDKDGESDAEKSELEDANLEHLTDAICLVVGAGSAVADAEGDDAAATSEEAAVEESSKAENAEDFGKMNLL